MSTSTDAFDNRIESLSPEILLKIFLNLASHETVILRSVCKEFLEIIDNNKSLWRILEWIHQEGESPLPALEMLDAKSGSTLREVSIFQGKGNLDKQFIEVLRRSNKTLSYLSLKIRGILAVSNEVIELASTSPLLNSVVLWPSDEFWMFYFPQTCLIRSSRCLPPTSQQSSNLRVVWCFESARDWDVRLDVSSLISFADPVSHDSLQLRSFINKFSSTLAHLSMDSDRGTTTPSLSCPSLRILEGRFRDGFPSWLDAPNLRIVITSDIDGSSLQQLPICVEELWLLSWHESLAAEPNLDFLPLVCPRLKILKLRHDFVEEGLENMDLLNSFTVRDDKVQKGVEIEGIKMVSLEKLIIPTELFEPAELDQLRDLVAKVIDIKDYPDFIELEY